MDIKRWLILQDLEFFGFQRFLTYFQYSDLIELKEIEPLQDEVRSYYLSREHLTSIFNEWIYSRNGSKSGYHTCRSIPKPQNPMLQYVNISIKSNLLIKKYAGQDLRLSCCYFLAEEQVEPGSSYWRRSRAQTQLLRCAVRCSSRLWPWCATGSRGQSSSWNPR